MLPFPAFSLEAPDTWEMCHALLAAPEAAILHGVRHASRPQ